MDNMNGVNQNPYGGQYAAPDGQMNNQFGGQYAAPDGQMNNQFGGQYAAPNGQMNNPYDGQMNNPYNNPDFNPYATREVNQVRNQQPQQNKNAEISGDAAWKATLALGAVNWVLVFLTTNFRTRYASVWILVILIFGLYCGYVALKNGMEKKNGLFLITGIIGIVVNAGATVLYVVRIAEAIIH